MAETIRYVVVKIRLVQDKTKLVVPGLKEAMPLLTQYEKLASRLNEVDVKIDALKNEREKIQQDLAVYKPLVGSLESLKAATSRIKTAMEQNALEERGVPIRR